MLRTILAVAGVVIAATTVAPPARQCPDVADAYTANGWHEYRANRMDRAARAFTAASERCPDHDEARLGRGYVALRNDDLTVALALFDEVLGRQPAHVDALVGRGLALWRSAGYDDARLAFSRALELDPGRSDVREHIAALPEPLGPPPLRPHLVLPDSVVHYARTQGTRFEVRRRDNEWQPFYIHGVNLGAALPGRFPSEFPDAATYREWIAGIAEMGANTIRVYTIHPPHFYDALAAHNAAHPDRPLWLLHGVWAELPPDDDYQNALWKGEFFGEVRRVIDVLHGRADVPRRPGHAAGYYTADVSRWTLGLVLGREWEPYSVAEFNERQAFRTAWHGRFFRISDAPAMDVWLAEAMDYAVAYETERYSTQRPVAFTSWPTLDPMRHDVELNVNDELRIRGIAFDPAKRGHNEDEVSIGSVPFRTTAEFSAGYFAAYHAYPYYPDFFLHDASYGAASSPWGASAYFGYLLDLRRAHADVPIVIAEYGVPASWGIAHFNPQGWHHGGHTEAAMAAINARLTKEIAAAGMAGGVVFAWIDEWFKHGWLDQPQELPAQRNRLWWNRLNPEQHYGIVAIEPERRLGWSARQRMAAWDTMPALYEAADGTRFSAHADEGHLWLHIQGPVARADRIVIGFDVTDLNSGALRLPDGPASPVGVEYALIVEGGDARIVAAPRTFPFELQPVPRGWAKRDMLSPVTDRPPGWFSGSWTQAAREHYATGLVVEPTYEPLLAVVNRARVGADSTNYLGMGYNRGILRRGPLPDGAWERLPDGSIELRLPWTLINVTDPSSRHAAHAGTVMPIDAIGIVAAASDGGSGWRSFPASGRRSDVARFTWPTWDEPRFRPRRRPAFDAMRAAFRGIGSNPSQVIAP
jgi:tetratricopeptide (TPR) repeat protein